MEKEQNKLLNIPSILAVIADKNKVNFNSFYAKLLKFFIFCLPYKENFKFHDIYMLI